MLKKIINVISESLIVSVLSIIICVVIAFTQTFILYNSEIAKISTYVVAPISALIGPLTYYSFLKKWLTLKRFVIYFVTYFIVGFILVAGIELIGRMGYIVVHFTALILFPLGYIVPEIVNDDDLDIENKNTGNAA